jgi:serine/threonine protein kinase
MLAAGHRVGTFEITGLLGAGGMGAVYKAVDTKLQREVAIKALPTEIAADPDRVVRFEREAQTLASLHHPNIAGIHELLDHDGARYLVLEYVPGETLAARIARGALPLDDALPIARQVAEALEAAHDLGIVHRDLKPANVMVQPNGIAKVLDFGLAKAQGHGDSGHSLSPTFTSPAMTAAGVILGTAAYMSPEQARGKNVDRRTDVWAFGWVLYEMLTGRPACAGETVSDIISGILRAEPDWAPLPSGTPESVRRLLALCLTKDAKERLPHIGLARIELASGRLTASSPAVMSSTLSSAQPQWRNSRLAWSVAGAAILAAVVTAGVSMRPKPAAPSVGVVRFDLQSPPGTERFGHNRSPRGTQSPAPHYAVSPDGRADALAPAPRVRGGSTPARYSGRLISVLVAGWTVRCVLRPGKTEAALAGKPSTRRNLPSRGRGGRHVGRRRHHLLCSQAIRWDLEGAGPRRCALASDLAAIWRGASVAGARRP